jgi:hypothetical protein
MSAATDLHAAVRQGILPALRALLAEHPRLANARSETDPRDTCPLRVAAEFGQAEAAKLLLEHGADGAAFFGRPGARPHAARLRDRRRTRAVAAVFQRLAGRLAPMRRTASLLILGQ